MAAKTEFEDHPLLTKAPDRRELLHYHEIPHWQQENEFILSGYRRTSNSLFISFTSIFFLHNETVSIWSHLLGAALFFWLPYYFDTRISVLYEHAKPSDLLVFSIYFLGVAICFILSSICHIVWNHSPAWAFYGNQLDYLGIILLMWGASVPTIFYGFYYDPDIQRMYWVIMTTVATTCAILTMHPRFCQPKFRPFRAAMYAGLGLTAIVFVVHGLLLHGWAVQKERMALDYMGWMAVFNFVGAALYASRVPERWFPYTFDIFGGSHQIFHILVIIAALVHFVGLTMALPVIRAAGDVTVL